jgi:catechol 2,3-dioxygenase-like lactoylglutathione lyase family enzyme
MIEGISHITFIVNDLELAATFFMCIFEAEEIYSSEEKTFSLSKEKFFLIGSQWIAIMEGNSLSERTYNHVAFKIAEEDFETYELKVRSLNLDIKPPRTRVEGERRSLYFYDFDNHLFELHTGTLSERLMHYRQT